jgi:hypothetical protein
VSNLVLWLDSDVARVPEKIREIAALANRKGVKVVVPAQVYLERNRQMLERMGDQFSRKLFDDFIDQLGIDIVEVPLDRARAGVWAELLNRRFPTGDAWKRAKLSAIRARLPDEATLDVRRAPMTTDWLTALEVERVKAYVAVEDKGEEWRALREMSPKRALFFDEAMRWLGDQTDVGAQNV